MVGQKYDDIITKLVAKGRWHFGQTEEGFSEIFSWRGNVTEFLQITYDTNGVVTNVYKYSVAH